MLELNQFASMISFPNLFFLLSSSKATCYIFPLFNFDPFILYFFSFILIKAFMQKFAHIPYILLRSFRIMISFFISNILFPFIIIIKQFNMFFINKFILMRCDKHNRHQALLSKLDNIKIINIKISFLFHRFFYKPHYKAYYKSGGFSILPTNFIS